MSQIEPRPASDAAWNRSAILAPMAPKSPKKLFLVDAMGFIFRAFFAPMDRLQNKGVPTKVPLSLLQHAPARHQGFAARLCGRRFRSLRPDLSRQAFHRLQGPAAAHARRSFHSDSLRAAPVRSHAPAHHRSSRLRSRRRHRRARPAVRRAATSTSTSSPATKT